MRSTANLRFVPHTDRLSARDAARQRIKEGLAKLKQKSREVKTSRRLLSALEALYAEGQDAMVRAAAIKIICDRLERLKRINKDLAPPQRRDLKIMLFFSHATMLPEKFRADVCAILQLHGDKMSIAEMFSVYPGMFKMLDEE